MKNFTQIIVSAVTGSIISFIIIFSLVPLGKKNIQIEHISVPLIKNAIYTADEQGNIIPLDFTEASKKVMQGVVNIRCLEKSEEKDSTIENLDESFEEDFYRHFFGPDRKRGGPARIGMGSGVIINENGYIITNNHVIEDAGTIEVGLHDNRIFEAKIIGIDNSTDLALLKIEETDLPVVPLDNSDEVEIGDWVLAIGNPYELTSTVTAGIVSAKSRNLNILKDKNAIESFIQTDAAINPGNSGGALVNLNGGLIGINTAIASPTGTYSGYGFAITSNIVAKVVEDLIRFGSVQRGYLGVIIKNIDGNLLKEKKLRMSEGAYIDSILTNGPAELAGIKPGDIITKIEQRTVRQTSELQEYVAQYSPGDKIKVTVVRDGDVKEFDAFLQNSEGNVKVVSNEKFDLNKILGAEFKTLEKNIAKNLRITGGVRVLNLADGKLKEQTDIKEGFIITKINEKQVNSVGDLLSILENKKGDGILIEGVYENLEGTFFYAFGN